MRYSELFIKLIGKPNKRNIIMVVCVNKIIRFQVLFINIHIYIINSNIYSH